MEMKELRKDLVTPHRCQIEKKKKIVKCNKLG